MLFRKYAIALAVGSLFTSMAFVIDAVEVPKDAYNDNPEYKFPDKWDKMDTTDIFTIPLDESAESQEEEFEKLDEGYPPKSVKNQNVLETHTR